MGILVSIAKAAEIAKITSELEEQLRKKRGPTRVVVIQVHNHTDTPLRLHSHDHESGNFGEPPSQIIPPQEVDIYGSRRRSWAIAGAIGSVTYRLQNKNANATVSWRNRYTPGRRNRASSSLSGTDAHHFELTSIIGGGSTAQARYELFKRDDEGIIIEGPGGSGNSGGSSGGGGSAGGGSGSGGSGGGGNTGGGPIRQH